MAVRLMLSLLVAAMIGAAAPAVAADAYATMVARLKSGDPKVDYRALRDAYAASPAYQPYGGDYDEARNAMRRAFNIHDCTSVLSNAAKVLDAIYIDIASHLLSAACLDTSNAKAEADFHRGVARGLMNAILASGDGKTTKTAYVVVTISEEYDVLHTLELELGQQALASEGGHVYDRMETKTESGEARTIFFQIDRPMAWMSKSLH